MTLTQEEVQQIASQVAIRIQGDNGTGQRITLAVIQSQLDEYLPMSKKDHDELTGLKAKFGMWRGTLGILQVIGTALGIWINPPGNQ